MPTNPSFAVYSSASPCSTTVPFAPCVKLVMESVSPSGSLSLLNTGIATGIEAGVLAPSSAATGTRFCTVTVTVAVSRSPPVASAWYWKVSVPRNPDGGVY